MWTLWIFGDNVEDRMGPFRFTLFYLTCGLIAGVGPLVHQPGFRSSRPSGPRGPSRASSAPTSCSSPSRRLVVMVPIFFYPLFFELPAVTYLLFWALTQLFSGTLALGGPGGSRGRGLVGARRGIRRRPGPPPLVRAAAATDPTACNRDEYGIEGAWT